MGLFPTDQAVDQHGNAAQRMAIVREKGTRNLVILFCTVIALWYTCGKVRDHFLLRKQWPQLAASPDGLTVVGALDRRGSYDRNFFRVVHANKSTRVEITDFGWRSLFSNTGKGLFTDASGETIRHAISVDGAAGYAMLAPFLHAGLERVMDSRVNAEQEVTAATPIVVRETTLQGVRERRSTLGELLSRFGRENASAPRGRGASDSEGGSLSGREVESGTAVPAETIIQACPIVLTGTHFTAGWLEKNPPNVLGLVTWTAHLDLTPEGRSRFFQWSSMHPEESVLFVLKSQISLGAQVPQAFDVNRWDIGPLPDEDAARALVDFVNQSARK